MTENDINDDKLQLPDGIGIKWKELARVLGYKNAIIEAIEKEKGSSTKECCIDLLVRWIGREGSKATAGRLADALEKIERKNLADNLIRGKQERNGSFHCPLPKGIGKLTADKMLLRSFLCFVLRNSTAHHFSKMAAVAMELAV